MKLDYTIVDSDYTNYAVIYICGQKPRGIVELVLVQSRAKTLATGTVTTKVTNALKALNATAVAVSQQGCSN